MVGTLQFTYLSFVTWFAFSAGAPADPTITPPALLPRQDDAAFVGWLSYNGSWSSMACNQGLTWYQNGNYAQCCPDTLASCNAPTACFGGSQIFPFSTTTITTACTGNYNDKAISICNTAFIYASFGDPSPKTDIICGNSSVNWSFYRSIPATATEKPSSSSTSNPASSQSPQDQKSRPKTWIIGAIVGPIAGVALSATILFLLIRRNNQQPYQSSLPQSGTASMGHPSSVTPFPVAKPQMTQDTPTPYLGQAAQHNPNHSYHHQHGMPSSPGSPAPQYNALSSPPPQGVFPVEAKYGHVMVDAVEMGNMSAVASPASSTAQMHTAELSGEHFRR
ncbi:hypothetical protein DM02DRAFT_660761 [Periconia macrospinosa]|uniref:Mid2 domain-containing protein n=1 Tax=Periconia macrospinosa TaxID=97972 RepID=A0A2V1D9K3_9PLEO|nr:hypothetical protein DM02DRAFT_660761 [Periconia macrospinosa]